ncbi:MAG: hypothetical protein Q9206_005003 [Seirophora lacunosa]
MPIPRLRRNTDGPPTSEASGIIDPKNRVSHACEPCRHRKTKCSDGKRDRTKREYNVMAGRVTMYEELLQELSSNLGEADRRLIQETLERGMSHGWDESSPQSSSQKRRASDGADSQTFHTEHQATGRAGSTESLDCVTEDFNRSDAARRTGFMGKASEVSWMEKLRRENDGDGDERHEDDPRIGFGSGLDESHRDSAPKLSTHSLSDVNYHCDDIPLTIQANVQAYEIPARATADSLLSCYFECVHPAFPILGKTTFVKQYLAFYDNPNLKTGPRWLAVLNLVFALSARYGRLIRTDWSEYSDDHAIYFSRARLLGLETGSIWVPAELQRIQVHGLASFYLMATHQINRAYSLSGIAIRQALTLGLNLRNHDPTLAEASKQIRYLVWWAIASTERVLSGMTGRPPSFAGADCSAPLPLPLEEESFMSFPMGYDTPLLRSLRRLSTDESENTDVSVSTPSSAAVISMPRSSREASKTRDSMTDGEGKAISPSNALFFLYLTKLYCLDNDILNQLYRPDLVLQPWATVQSRIAGFQKRLTRWHSALPAIFDFARHPRDQTFVRQRMCLAFSFYSSTMIVNRACLCKIDDKIPNETRIAKEADKANAMSCVLAAKSLVDMLPDEPNPVGLYPMVPWWNMVHHLMQTATVLMLEISMRAVHCPEMSDQLLAAAQKAVAWLQSMATDDQGAARAWRLSSDVLRKVAPKIGRTVDDRLTQPLPSTNENVFLQGFSWPPIGHNMPAYADHMPVSSANLDNTNYQAGTMWDTLMLNSYDNSLPIFDPANPQPPSTQAQWF